MFIDPGRRSRVCHILARTDLRLAVVRLGKSPDSSDDSIYAGAKQRKGTQRYRCRHVATDRLRHRVLGFLGSAALHKRDRSRSRQLKAWGIVDDA